MKIEIGKAAPNFSLLDSEKNKFSLSEQVGNNVLLLFFPAAFTSVCTAELCSIREDLSRYNNWNTKVFGISVDSVFTLAKYKEEQKLNFPLLSDFNASVSAMYDCLYQDWILDMKNVSKRSAFIIDKEGVVQYAEVLENAGDLPNFEAIQEKLGAL
jgi:glutaredoxin-dependent peroxiredoxin